MGKGRAAELWLALAMVVVVLGGGRVVEAQSYCVAATTASAQALQAALDYACGAGADCTSIQANGLCYLPNTLQNHSSYAFNSYYQRMGEATGTCDFSGAATLTTTNPSYGSCIYPASQSTAGGTTSTTNTTTTTPTTVSPVYGLGPSSSTTTTSTINRAAFLPSITIILPLSLLLVFSLVFSPI